MNQNRPCGCKGRRSCLICEEEFKINPVSYISLKEKKKSFEYCYLCRKAWPGWDNRVEKDCPNHSGESISVSGIWMLPNFITSDERDTLLKGMENQNWDLSQSGRRKQNYGPKCNFKKKKMKIGNFNGFPSYSKIIHEKFKLLPILEGFRVVEQCSLEYDPKRGASIEPHIDDCWIWGERIVTANILGDTYLSMYRYNGSKEKYNLNNVTSYPHILDYNERFDSLNTKSFCFNSDKDIDNSDVVLRVFMPEKSLIVLYGSARYEWEHYVLREDIKDLRLCLAFREFTPPYLPGGEFESIGCDILKMSSRFW